VKKSTVVLVHGAWTGAWVWADVMPLLHERGMSVSAVALTGSVHSETTDRSLISLKTHVDDVVQHIEMEGLENVTLVGWSYGGMVATGAADALPLKVTRLIYLDAFVPEDGQSLTDCISPESRARHEVFAFRGEPIPPLPLEIFEIQSKQAAEFIKPRLTGQPWRTFFEPIKLTGTAAPVPKGYILCAGSSRSHFEHTYQRMLKDAGVRTSIIDGDHFCPVTNPVRTAEAIAALCFDLENGAV
jgi:pimeloyl-ACP methyl ester carboxylesterase